MACLTKGLERYPRLLTIPFSSSRKMMLTVTDVSGRQRLCEDGMALPPQCKHFTVCKGAPTLGAEAGYEP